MYFKKGVFFMNPFELKVKNAGEYIMDWNDLATKPYDKNETSPYTKTRIILMNGTEYEAVKFSHNFQRHCCDNDIRRELALTRRIEQQQQKAISNLKPINENQLETTISYEQLAVDLTAFLAKRSKCPDLKRALDFALLEDFDHLYRFANLLEHDYKIKAEKLVGKYTEIMPGRPTIAHHRHPYDTVKRHADSRTVDIQTLVDSHIITAAEQQTMNYYMNLGAFYINDYGRRLFTEIGMVEEDHVTQYGSLLAPNVTMLECNLIHEYVECYLYYSMFEDETDKYVKKIWERFFEQEVSHLQMANYLLKRYEKRDYQDVLPCAEFPDILKLESNIDYVRDVLKGTVELTGDREDYTPVNQIPEDAQFFIYQGIVNKPISSVASHAIIKGYIDAKGQDYRFQVDEHPITQLQNREKDNTQVGR